MSSKRCSTSTDVEAADVVNKAMESLQNAKRDLDNLETKLNPKKHKIHKKKFSKKGMKKLRNSMEEMAETMKILDGTLVKIQKKKENVEAIRDHECCYDDQDWKGNNENTLFVQGFDTSLSRDEIKSLLRSRFRVCGEIKRIFVPVECLRA